ncbi:hypothetical protein [Staphylococcus aureus]|uniref:hypothetical protein n=1 Tax=Staphylococcus aureus TaxID=1280 RepID=UPI0011AADCCF|nr:hypothetical protein [Staphylococcus aureus]
MIIVGGICSGENIWVGIKCGIRIICGGVRIFKGNCVGNDCLEWDFVMSWGMRIGMNGMMARYGRFMGVMIEGIDKGIYVMN